jgi:NADPH-dependent ferric siderophore reductase
VGDKLQVRTEGGGLTSRTYTPVHWEPTSGSTRLLAYLHGSGPGSTWARTVAPGDTGQVFGPRRSLKLGDVSTPLVVVGDETSFALAAAWNGARPDTPAVATVFEVTDVEPARGVLDTIGIPDARLVARRGDDHMPELTTAVVEALAARPDATLCLTGKAQTIAAIRKALKGTPAGGHPTLVKAYWDENRAGLD